ncbi:hypothetical protein KIN20_025582 [Parelaphostrongylus tenuis]|uniref:Uncharacterized protein n=1 Tax=Parelaphostrongylus tenuis TaxID=148309 RepID=A0AAD5MYM3_PARTN|nr:hypothetical protein KIN20_025582 [Parelaphostrongylus tenuis]
MIQDPIVKFRKLSPFQFGDMQLCFVLKQDEGAATLTGQGPIVTVQILTVALGPDRLSKCVQEDNAYFG